MVCLLFFCSARLHHLAHGRNGLGITETARYVYNEFDTVNINTERELSIELRLQHKSTRSQRSYHVLSLFRMFQRLEFSVVLLLLYQLTSLYIFFLHSVFMVTTTKFSARRV